MTRLLSSGGYSKSVQHKQRAAAAIVLIVAPLLPDLIVEYAIKGVEADTYVTRTTGESVTRAMNTANAVKQWSPVSSTKCHRSDYSYLPIL